MMEHLVLHERTRRDVAQFVTQPGHSLLLIGPRGSGKTTLALELVAAVLGTAPEKLATHPYFLHITPEKRSVPIEAIRGAQEFVRLRTTGNQPIRRAIMLDDAHCLTTEAQNAFLKLLEEPPADTLIVMTAAGQDSLLPTVLSRTQKITLKAPLQSDLLAHFTTYSSSDITRAYHLSKGRPGLMTHILSGEGDNPLLEYVDVAKRIFQMTTFERLVLADQWSKKKEDLPSLLWAMQRVSDVALYQAAQKDADKQVARWQNTLKQILHTQDSLRANPQPKLLLTNLMLQL
jgi:DNA polymerase-3 subunit delta'